MRRSYSLIPAGTLLLAAAFALAACGHKSPQQAADIANLDTMDSSAGLSNDMSAIDATGNDAALQPDNATMPPALDNDTGGNAM